jgi:hypothetical protein
MSDDQEKTRQAKEIEQELNRGLSRRAFLDHLAAIGVGFGAAFAFGLNRSEAAVPGDALVNLKSTNPVLNDIVEGSQQDQLLDNEDAQSHVQLAQYRRAIYRRAIYRRIVPYGRIVPYRRVIYPRGPYGRIPYLRGPYARIPYARVF